MRPYLEPDLLSAIPLTIVPAEQRRALIEGTVFRAAAVLAEGHLVHPSLIEHLAQQVAVELLS